MNKIIIIGLIAMMLLVITGCGESQPIEEINDQGGALGVGVSEEVNPRIVSGSIPVVITINNTEE